MIYLGYEVVFHSWISQKMTLNHLFLSYEVYQHQIHKKCILLFILFICHFVSLQVKTAGILVKIFVLNLCTSWLFDKLFIFLDHPTAGGKPGNVRLCFVYFIVLPWPFFTTKLDYRRFYEKRVEHWTIESTICLFMLVLY